MCQAAPSGCAQRRIAGRSAHTPIRPYGYVAQQFDPIQFLPAQQRVDVNACWNVEKGKWAQVAFDERNVGRKTRNALVEMFEGLQVRQVHHQEKSLFERVVDSCPNAEHQAKQLLDALWQTPRACSRCR